MTEPGPDQARNETLLADLEASSRTLRDAEDDAREERELRNCLVVEAVDAGIPYAVIARAAGITKSRICGLLVEGWTASDPTPPPGP